MSFGDVFTTRQKMAILTLVRLTKEIGKTVSVSDVLALSISRYAGPIGIRTGKTRSRR
jgi:hypothetical protein